MKNNQLIKVLLFLLVAISLWSVYLCWSYIAKSRDLRTLQGQVTYFTQRDQALQNLLGESVEYGKKNPDINKLLEAAGVRPTASNASAPATAQKPATK